MPRKSKYPEQHPCEVKGETGTTIERFSVEQSPHFGKP
nr:MAG TPA: hypothetical protein [Caudoviricetes sp.]